MPYHSPAIHALLSCRQAVLASQSASVPGFPYTSFIPIATTPTGQIISVLSESAQHSLNIAIDARVSLLLHDDLEQNWQAATRLSVLGLMRPLRADRETERTLRSAFDQLHPELKDMNQDSDYRCWLLEPVRFRFVSLLGRTEWLDQISPAPFELSLAEHTALSALLGSEGRHVEIVQACRYGIQIIEQGRVRFLALNAPVTEVAELLTQVQAGAFVHTVAIK